MQLILSVPMITSLLKYFPSPPLRGKEGKWRKRLTSQTSSIGDLIADKNDGSEAEKQGGGEGSGREEGREMMVVENEG